MHTSFDLATSTSIDEFQNALDAFTGLMIAKDLIVSTGPVAERCKHPIMDTDEQRGHQFFFVMIFRDREQCDAAVSHIQEAATDSDPVHRAVYANIVDPIFSCWID
ncbi:MAG: hypothetical protein ACR2QT_15720 [Woeseiaceae bacterium]